MTPLEQKQKELIKLQDQIADILLLGWNNEENEIPYPEKLDRKIESLKSEIASLENQSESEQITDEEIEKMFPIIDFNGLNGFQTASAQSINLVSRSKQEGAKAIRDLMQSRLFLQAEPKLRV